MAKKISKKTMDKVMTQLTQFLVRRGNEILDTDYELWKYIVRDDTGMLRFIEVHVDSGCGMPEEKKLNNRERRAYEEAACMWLANYDGEPAGFTFDILRANLINDERLMVRLYRNILSCDCV